MFLMAEPHITGVILRAKVARRIAARSSSTEIGSSLMNFSASSSSTSATSWMIFSRAAAVAFDVLGGDLFLANGLAVFAFEEERLARRSGR